MTTYKIPQLLTRPSRSLHLVDLENLAGTASVTEPLARHTAMTYLATSEYCIGDLIVVASSHRNGFAARAAFPGATVRWRSGHDGADLALLDAWSEFDPLRFTRLVIGSGDGIFSELALSARQSGLNVSVVTRRCAASAVLSSAASSVALLGKVA